MKRLRIFSLTLLFLPILAFTQKEIIAAATELIAAGKYNAANKYLDSILKKNSRNMDALMMKGNVLLNRAVENLPPVKDVTISDESIFTESPEEKSVKVLPIDTVRAIEKIWRKCLKLDSTRNDIRKGLCVIYSMALMTEDLKKEIAVLAKTEKNEDGGQAFRMAEYARKLKEHGRFADAMEVYQFIARLYPGMAGIRSDIGSEYFYEGKIRDALSWLDSCFAFNKIDETSFLNGAFIYSELGHFDNAQNVLNAYSRIYQRKMDWFYYGLRLFADSSQQYFDTLNSFISAVDSNFYADEIYTAKKLIALSDSFSVRELIEMANDQAIPDYYRVLIFVRAVRQFPNDCEPFVYYGAYQCAIRNYSAAVQMLEDEGRCEIQWRQKELGLLHYAYSLYMLAENEKALSAFGNLYYSLNPFMQQAAKYFSAKILFELKRTDEANKVWKELAQAEERTKYAELAKQRLR